MSEICTNYVTVALYMIMSETPDVSVIYQWALYISISNLCTCEVVYHMNANTDTTDLNIFFT